MVLVAMRPNPPSLDLDGGEIEGVSAGVYQHSADTILIYGRRHLSDHKLAVLTIHELSHASGHPSRLARAFYVTIPHVAEPTDEHGAKAFITERATSDAPLDVATEAEEFVAHFATMLVCISTGIHPTNGAHHCAWIERAAQLPIETLRAAIADAISATCWMLHTADVSHVAVMFVAPQPHETPFGEAGE